MTAPASPPVAVGVDMETDVQFEVWQDGDMVASADSLSDAQHYMAIYGQDGPVEAVTAITTRFPWFNVVRALAYPVSGDGSSLRDTHRAPVPPVVGWQDISTAPRNGTPVIGMARYADATAGFPRIVCWQDGAWREPGRSVGEALVCWAWVPRDILGDWPSEPFPRRVTVQATGFYAPPAASVSPGMETLQASECTKHGEADQ